MAIELTHYVHGPISVEIYDEATWWMQRRVWSCPDNPELGSFEDGHFDEAPEAIDAMLRGSTRDGNSELTRRSEAPSAAAADVGRSTLEATRFAVGDVVSIEFEDNETLLTIRVPKGSRWRSGIVRVEYIDRPIDAANAHDALLYAAECALNFMLNTQSEQGIAERSDDEFMTTKLLREALALACPLRHAAASETPSSVEAVTSKSI